jgi:hypothetical protein
VKEEGERVRVNQHPPWLLARELEPNGVLFPDYLPSIHPSWSAGGCWFILVRRKAGFVIYEVDHEGLVFKRIPF